MSAPSPGKGEQPLLDTTPRCSRPTDGDVEKAKRAIPDVLDEWLAEKGTRSISAKELFDRLKEKVHSLPAAQWAFHELYQDRDLPAEQRRHDKPAFGAGFGERPGSGSGGGSARWQIPPPGLYGELDIHPSKELVQALRERFPSLPAGPAAAASTSAPISTEPEVRGPADQPAGVELGKAPSDLPWKPTRRAADILRVMLREGWTSPGKRASQDAIADTVEEGTSREDFSWVWKLLRNGGLIASTGKGRSAGTYLTEAGVEAARSLPPK
jgi:hypothetical protein